MTEQGYIKPFGLIWSENRLSRLLCFTTPADVPEFDAVSPHLEGGPGASFSFKTWPNTSAMAFSVRLGLDKGKAKCRITPSPYNRSEEVEYNLSRPVEGDAPFGFELLDPKQRYTVEITNSDPEKKLYFNGVSYWLASE